MEPWGLSRPGERERERTDSRRYEVTGGMEDGNKDRQGGKTERNKQ